jgi:hypothetical protein
MLNWIFGILLVAAGVGLTTNALGAVDRAARLWPRRYTKGDAGLFASSAFLMRFIGLLLAAAGLALILLEVAG